MKKPKKIFYFSGTHWDREWYNPFQGFRYKLVKITDEIIDTLERDPDFTSFTFDGQTIVLEDYCLIRPENKDRLENLIRSGRIHVGPWYVMPDEFLCSGESLIKNLLKGHDTARNFGAENAMKYGFVCDIFGHIGQLPQILKGFGIKGALLGRGTNYHTTPAHFLWESYDGSRCLTFKVPEECGYGSFWYDVWAKYDPNRDLEGSGLISNACSYIEKEMKRSDSGYVVLMDSMDHSPIQQKAPWLAEKLSEIYSCPVVFESLEKMTESVISEDINLQIKKGELIETAREVTLHNMLIPYTLSSRYDIKKENDECQILLEKWINFFTVSMSDSSNPISLEYLNQAYTYLLKCHAHDSICGCSIDSVHKDMHYRFRQVKNISDEIMFDCITRNIPGSEIKADANILKNTKKDNYEIKLDLWNPLPFERNEDIQADIYFPQDFPSKYYEQSDVEKINSFKIFDMDDNEVPYTLLKIETDKFVRVHDSDYRQKRDVYTVSFYSSLIAFGKTSYRIEPYSKPSRYLGKLTSSFNHVENSYLRLEINDNGTLNILCRKTGRKYLNLHYFIDDCEIGDGWFHVSPVSNRQISSKGFPTSIVKIADGINCCIFEVTKFMKVPSGINTGRSIERTDDFTLLEVISEIKLSSSSDFVEIKTKVKNTACNHRLRLVAISGIDGNDYFSDQPFAYSQRKAGLSEQTQDWKEYEKAEKAFSNLIWKKDNSGNGLLFISKAGLHECAVYDDEEKNVLVTLFRSFSNTVLTNGETDGQLNGNLEFNYRIYPIDINKDYSDFLREKDSFQCRPVCYSYTADANQLPNPGLKPLFKINNDALALSVIKMPEDKSKKGFIIRVFNTKNTMQKGEIEFHFQISHCFETNLQEEITQSPDIRDNKIIFPIREFEIKTFLVEPASDGLR